MTIKNWGTTKYNSTEHSMWRNTLPQYKSFHQNFYVTVGRIGSTKDFFMSVVKEGREIRVNEYVNFKDAKASAIRYMKAHPRG